MGIAMPITGVYIDRRISLYTFLLFQYPYRLASRQSNNITFNIQLNIPLFCFIYLRHKWYFKKKDCLINLNLKEIKNLRNKGNFIIKTIIYNQ